MSDTTAAPAERMANLTSLHRELAELATHFRPVDRPSQDRIQEFRGPRIVIRGSTPRRRSPNSQVVQSRLLIARGLAANPCSGAIVPPLSMIRRVRLGDWFKDRAHSP